MAVKVLAKPGSEAFDKLMRSQGLAFRRAEAVPKTLKAWEQRRNAVRAGMLTAMGPMPEEPAPLEPQSLGMLQRTGYRIEKLVFQSRPNIWVTSSLYIPDGVKGKVP